MSKRSWYVGAGLLVLVMGLGASQLWLQRAAAAQSGGAVQAPMFDVDPMWPKPLPNNWLLGSTIGVWVDERDHVWIIHRSSATLNAAERGAEGAKPTGEC